MQQAKRSVVVQRRQDPTERVGETIFEELDRVMKEVVDLDTMAKGVYKAQAQQRILESRFSYGASAYPQHVVEQWSELATSKLAKWCNGMKNPEHRVAQMVIVTPLTYALQIRAMGPIELALAHKRKARAYSMYAQDERVIGQQYKWSNATVNVEDSRQVCPLLWQFLGSALKDIGRESLMDKYVMVALVVRYDRGSGVGEHADDDFDAACPLIVSISHRSKAYMTLRNTEGEVVTLAP
jgi:alkylated DNA repair dioxygenase AlkB